MPNKHKFWQFQNLTGGTAELLLYGDIADTSWFGDEVTPKQFADELKALGDVAEIDVRINSGGGDVFAAQAIGNLLEQHKANVVAKIDGLCASAATIVASHCDKVIAANDSTYMIHPVKMGVFGFIGAEKLQECLSALTSIRENILKLYARKTGRSIEEVAELMDKTSWWTGEQAKEEGFVDELTDDGTGNQVENRNGVLFINSVSMNLPFDKTPKFVQDSLADASNAGRFVNKKTGKPEKNKEEENMGEKINTAEELRNAYPELIAKIEEEAADRAVNAERERIREIEEMALPGSEEATNEAKFTKPVSADAYARAAMKLAKAQGEKHLKNAALDAENGGANGIKNGAVENGAGDAFLAALKGIGERR